MASTNAHSPVLNNTAQIAVLIPCLNEELTIGKVISDFQKNLPGAKIYVFDNNCTDRTPEIAQKAGAIVVKEKRPGKGSVVASMFKKVKADYYVMVDGDDTYDAGSVSKLLNPLMTGEADLTVATRLSEHTDESFRPLHVFGNNLVKSLVNWIFHSNLADIMSGYRGFTREFVETIPVLSSGFEVETELTIRTLDYGFVIEEIPVPYRERPEGSFSKLHTFRDGYRVLSQIGTIAKAYKPFTFFGLIGLFFGLIGLGTGIEVIFDFLADRYVNKVPTAILSSACMILSFGCIGIGIILNVLSYRFRELEKIIQNSANLKRKN
ncbi:MAG: glycosyltransferase [SAR324 cluster bacterium]|nr:glycosyltransferase [SAR324 cluster bacterium]